MSQTINEDEEASIHGEILQEIFSRVPLIDLVGASHVSKSWQRDISSSLRSLNPRKPWLILHSQLTRPPYTTSSHGYDPRSHVWIEVSKPPIKYVSSLRSSHSNFLYMMSLWKLSFSFDPLNLEWDHVDAPKTWGADPVVGKVGDSIVVAGTSPCDFEEEPLAVEVFDMSTRAWRTCDSMPYRLNDLASSTWLSIASISNKLFVMEKSSGVMHSFDVKTDHWARRLDFDLEQGCFYSLIGNAGDRLIMVGLIGNVEKVEKVKLWEMETETETENFRCKNVIEMPLELIKKLRCETFGFSSIKICSERGIVYIYNSAKMVPELVVCKLLNGGGCGWGSLKIPVVAGNNGRMMFAFTCADVKINELQKSMRMKNLKFKEMVL